MNKSPAEQVKVDAQLIIDALARKWKLYCEKLPYTADDPLALRINDFATVAIPAMHVHVPSTKAAPPGALWMMIFTAIQESKTHPQKELNKAIAELEAKYARTQN